MRKSILAFWIVLIFSLVTAAAFQINLPDKVFKPDLSGIVTGKGWTVFGRNVSLIEANGKKGIHFDEKEGVGIAWLNDYKFKDGTIEFDVRGKNVLQKSFVGIAFQGIDENSFESIYFRPFNFRSNDPERHAHAVQYVAEPDYGWKKLRTEHPGKYEQPLDPSPNPDDWFHARIVIKGKTVNVFVNDQIKPSLTVEKLIESREGRIGLFVGDDSDGDFANLKITAAP